MRPLRITALMASGVVMTAGDGLPLDAILDFGYVRRALGPDFYQPGIPRVHPALPLRKVMFGSWHGAWLWAASNAVLSDAAPKYTQHWHKKTLPDLPGVTVTMPGRTFQHAGGRYKEQRQILPTLFAPEITWFAYGDLSGVAELLGYVSGIGKKVDCGNGWVREWRVEPWGQDWSLARDGRPMRSLPLPLAQQLGISDGHRALIGYRPPYYCRSHQDQCLVP